jgi:hypothetical protein
MRSWHTNSSCDHALRQLLPRTLARRFYCQKKKTAVYVSSYNYMCPHTSMCPHTTIYLSAYCYYVCVLISLYMCVLILRYMCPHAAYTCPHTTICVLILLCVCLCMCVLILRYMCPHAAYTWSHTTICVLILLCVCILRHAPASMRATRGPAAIRLY